MSFSEREGTHARASASGLKRDVGAAMAKKSRKLDPKSVKAYVYKGPLKHSWLIALDPGPVRVTTVAEVPRVA